MPLIKIPVGDRVSKFLSYGLSPGFSLFNTLNTNILILLSNTLHPHAAYFLAASLSQNQNSQKSFLCLKWLFHPKAKLALWDYWNESRNDFLTQFLLTHGKLVNVQNNLNIFVYSRLLLSQFSELTNPKQEHLKIIIKAVDDIQPIIQENAIHILKNIKARSAITIICESWYQTRSNILESIIKENSWSPTGVGLTQSAVYMLQDRFEYCLNYAEELVPFLVELLKDKDRGLVEKSIFCLRNLTNQTSINVLCRQWYEKRSQKLNQIMLECRYVATEPLEIHIATALKQPLNPSFYNWPPHFIPHLTVYLTDKDKTIRENSSVVLSNLTDPQSQKKFLTGFLEKPQNEQKTVVKNLKFPPPDPYLFAAALFFAEAWETYENFDFDRRLLHRFYTKSGEDTRKQIARTVQTSGKKEYLPIILGTDQSFSRISQSRDEIQSTLDALINHQDYEALWEYLKLIYVDQSLIGFKQLLNVGWSPQTTTEVALYNRLVVHVSSIPSFTTASLGENIPFAIPSSVLNFRGRINQVAFANHSPHLAIATNKRAVMIWNYQKGSSEYLIKDFRHSIGQLSYDQQDNLFIGEKTNSTDMCDIWLWQDQILKYIGYHQGSVTSISPVRANNIVTTGKDLRIVNWDFEKKTMIAETKIGVWPRAVSRGISDTILFSHRWFELLAFPNLEPRYIHQQKHYGSSKNGMPTTMTDIDTGNAFLIGKHNGQILKNSFEQPNLIKEEFLLQVPTKITGIALTPNTEKFVFSTQNGDLYHYSHQQFYPANWDANIPQRSITSLAYSPAQKLISTGTDEHQTILWDIRPMDCPAIISKKLNEVSTEDWATLKFVAQRGKIDLQYWHLLQYLILILEDRYRYDIEIGEGNIIQPGEFDIEIGG
jgi:WD40 repeat protein